MFQLLKKLSFFYFLKKMYVEWQVQRRWSGAALVRGGVTRVKCGLVPSVDN